MVIVNMLVYLVFFTWFSSLAFQALASALVTLFLKARYSVVDGNLVLYLLLIFVFAIISVNLLIVFKFRAVVGELIQASTLAASFERPMPSGA